LLEVAILTPSASLLHLCCRGLGPLLREMVHSPALSPHLWHAEEMVPNHVLGPWSICHLLDLLALHFGGHSMVSAPRICLPHADGRSRPLNYFWLRASPAGAEGLISGECTVDINFSSQPTSALNSAADLALLIVPIIALGKLTMDFNRKIGLVVIFMIGMM
jgi:hypothetical protein